MTETDQVLCCGERPASVAGKPLVLACNLCRRSPTYVFRRENRADGKPYEPVRSLGDGQETG